ncbi:MAG: arylsulfatase [Burkholderiales bacterium]|nr:MAG: arylsulfatase [Burkholderiales bacterium]
MSGEPQWLSGDPGEGWQGRIGRTLAESTPWWRPRSKAPEGAPNVVVILLDDLGFSDFGCYGSEIRTPNIDALAAGGLRFTGYTTVPMCTPARAALLTGKDPHSVGCGWLTHNNPGFPGYQAGEISPDAPTLPELLRQGGWSTYGVGKWHNTADHNVQAAGDRGAWPLQRGFDRYYGFLGAETNCFSPGHLIDGNDFVVRDAYPTDYFCSDDWTDRATGWLRAHRSADSDKPFFLYVAHNAPHVPLQARAGDLERYRGAYDAGWDRLRESRFARQKALGVVPADWRLPGLTPGVPAWDTTDPARREVMAHYMALYAAMVDNIDQNIGRLLACLRELGVLENTIVVLTSDNGASSIGGPDGAANIFEKRITRVEDPTLSERMMRSGALGGIDSYPAYPVGWGNACNTPFRFFKRTPMNGGIRVPMIVSWPSRIPDGGAIRRDWIHVTDTLPTLLDAVGLDYPAQRQGYRTRALDGSSWAPLLADAGARSPRAARGTGQQYELEGNRGYIRGRWKVVSLQPPGTKIDLDNWMLFDLESDPTEIEDLAAARPEVLAEMVAAFEDAAHAGYLYPLDNRDNRRVLAVPPFLEQAAGRPRTFYAGGETAAVGAVSMLIADRDFTIGCEFDWALGDEGVIWAIGDSFIGFALFVLDGRLQLSFRRGVEVERTIEVMLDPGVQRVSLEHRAGGKRRGTGALSVNGRLTAPLLDMSPTVLRLGGEGLDVGCDRRRKVSMRYATRGVFAYPNRIASVCIEPGAQAPDSFANRPERLAQAD